MKSDERLIDTPQGRIWVGIYGQDMPRIPILVLHGGPGALSMPQEICDLADQRPVIFYDQLGCGRSDRPSNKDYYCVEHYVNELAAIREALNIDTLHLMGHSWGSMLAAEYILRKSPEGVRSLLLCGPLLSTPLWENDQRAHINRLAPQYVRFITEAEEQGRFDGGEYQHATMEFYRKHVCRLNPWPDVLVEAMNQLNMDVYMRMWGPSEFTTTGSLKGVDLLPRLPEIKQPVLLVCGEHDESMPCTVQTYRDALPRGEMAVIPNASHCHHLEQPDLFRALVRNFLDRVERP